MIKRFALLLAAGCTAALALAVPAAAHVTVHSPDATQGGYALLSFRVPTESATASTTEVAVQVPTDAPIRSVSVQPVPGWAITTKTTKLTTPLTTRDGKVTEVVSQITWKADGAASAIKPGQFAQFFVSAGPLPKVASLRFPAIQTYSDGSVVRWIETAAPGSSAEPDHPAPTLTLAPAASTSTDAPAAASSGSGDGSGSGSGEAVILSVIALVLAAGALGLTIVNRARGPR